MKTYAEFFKSGTHEIVKVAHQIETAAIHQGLNFKHKLVDVVYELRHLYSDRLFRDKFVGAHQFIDAPWDRGMCALTAKSLYTLFPGLFEAQAIKIGSWEHAPVVFVRDKLLGLPLDPTGQQFAPLVVPYELGVPLNRELQTPNSAEFIKIIEKRLGRQ